MIKLGDCETFRLTSGLRYATVKKTNGCDVTTADRVLQQAWQGDKGTVDWREVPSFGEIIIEG